MGNPEKLFLIFINGSKLYKMCVKKCSNDRCSNKYHLLVTLEKDGTLFLGQICGTGRVIDCESGSYRQHLDKS
jgi:hypothetical protein